MDLEQQSLYLNSLTHGRFALLPQAEACVTSVFDSPRGTPFPWAEFSTVDLQRCWGPVDNRLSRHLTIDTQSRREIPSDTTLIDFAANIIAVRDVLGVDRLDSQGRWPDPSSHCGGYSEKELLRRFAESRYFRFDGKAKQFQLSEVELFLKYRARAPSPEFLNFMETCFQEAFVERSKAPHEVMINCFAPHESDRVVLDVRRLVPGHFQSKDGTGDALLELPIGLHEDASEVGSVMDEIRKSDASIRHEFPGFTEEEVQLSWSAVLQWLDELGALLGRNQSLFHAMLPGAENEFVEHFSLVADIEDGHQFFATEEYFYSVNYSGF